MDLALYGLFEGEGKAGGWAERMRVLAGFTPSDDAASGR